MAQTTNRVRQWSRTAYALALLFGSLPLASKLFVGVWGFEGSAELAFLCLILGTYFRVIGWRNSFKVRDAATMLDRAMRQARGGNTDQAIELLTQTIHRDPRFWQALQYRGELHLFRGHPAAALQDFMEAARLAPNETHLRALREQAQQQLQGNQTLPQ